MKKIVMRTIQRNVSWIFMGKENENDDFFWTIKVFDHQPETEEMTAASKEWNEADCSSFYLFQEIAKGSRVISMVSHG